MFYPATTVYEFRVLVLIGLSRKIWTGEKTGPAVQFFP